MTHLFKQIIAAILFMSPSWGSPPSDTSSRDLTLFHAECTELLDPHASRHLVEPWFHPDNPLTADIPLTFMRHKFAEAFFFSRDGRYVAIHHDIYPDAEQITLRSLETGEKLSSLLWRGKGEKLFDLKSAAFDGESRRIVGLANHFFTDGTDAVVTWDGQAESLVEHVEIKLPQDQDYVRVNASGNNHSFHTEIALEHPYFIRTRLRSSDHEYPHDSREFSAQIVEWKNKLILNFSSAAVRFLNVIPQPISAAFRYVAILQNDSKTVQLMSFDEIAKRMNPQFKETLGLFARVRQTVERIVGPRIDNKQLLTATRSSRTIAQVSPFTASLVHEQPVLRALLSPWAPFIVTQTQAGLHIWNAKTGAQVGSIAGSIQQFRLLTKMGLLAFVDGRNNLILYSLFSASQIAEFPNFESYRLSSLLESYGPGSVYITLRDGRVIHLSETFEEGLAQPLYDIADTGVRLEIPLNQSYRTPVQTKKGKYLVQVYEVGFSEKTLKADVFALDGSGRHVAALEFPIQAFQPEFRLNPTGQKVVYTQTPTQTAILHLDRYLEERDL